MISIENNQISVESLRLPIKRKIGCDLDGVVVNIHPMIFRGIKMVLGVDVDNLFKTGKRTDYWIDNWPEIKALAGGPEFVRRICTSSYIYRHAPPVDLAVPTLNRLHEQGHDIYFVTSRPKETSTEATMAWFYDHQMEWAAGRVYFADEVIKGASFKDSVVSSLCLEVFIDDSIETMEAFKAKLALKLVPVCSWNRNKRIGKDTEFVSSWPEIEKKINRLT